VLLRLARSPRGNHLLWLYFVRVYGIGTRAFRPARENLSIWKPRSNWPEKCWRRGRDSNSRYPFEYVRFRGGCLQPLGHLSGCQRFARPSAGVRNSCGHIESTCKGMPGAMPGGRQARRASQPTPTLPVGADWERKNPVRELFSLEKLISPCPRRKPGADWA
jgi:hypothetical protein